MERGLFGGREAVMAKLGARDATLADAREKKMVDKRNICIVNSFNERDKKAPKFEGFWSSYMPKCRTSTSATNS